MKITEAGRRKSHEAFKRNIAMTPTGGTYLKPPLNPISLRGCSRHFSDLRRFNSFPRVPQDCGPNVRYGIYFCRVFSSLPRH